MNKEQVSNRPKRARIREAKTGVAQPRISTLLTEESYNKIENQASTKVDKKSRTGNYYKLVQNTNNKKYTKLTNVFKRHSKPLMGNMFSEVNS